MAACAAAGRHCSGAAGGAQGRACCLCPLAADRTGSGSGESEDKLEP